MHSERIRNVEHILWNLNKKKCFMMQCVQDSLEKPIDRLDVMSVLFCHVLRDKQDTIYENVIRLNAKLEYYFA